MDYSKNRDWNKYINSQRYSDCQLVSAVNCYHYLTGKTVEYKSKQYEKLVDLVGARHGGAISIEKAYKKLGIKVINHYHNDYEFHKSRYREGKVISIPLPMEISVYHKRYGRHSVAVVDYESRTGCYRIPNFKYATSLDGWIFKEDLDLYIADQEKFSDLKWRYRLFGLEEK